MSLYRNIIAPSVLLLKKENRNKGVKLLFLLLGQSLIDLLSVTSFFPLALVIVDPTALATNKVVSSFFLTFPILSTNNLKIYLIGFILLFFLLKHIAGVYIMHFRTTYAFDLASSLSRDLMKNFMNQSYTAFYKQKAAGELVNMVHIPASFAYNIVLALTTLLVEWLILIGLSLFMISYSWKAFISMGAVGLPAVFFYQLTKTKLTNISHRQKSTYPQLIERVLSFFNSFVEITIYQKASSVVHQTDSITNELNKLQIKQTTLHANSLRLFETTAAIGLCLLIGYSAFFNLPTASSILLVGIYAACGFRAIPSFNRIIAALFQLRTNEYAVTELNRKLVPTTPANAKKENEIHYSSTILFDSIHFSYDERPMLFTNLNLTISKGEKIAITGISGSGKSTILLFLMGFLKPTSGEIRIDQVPITDDKINSWRKLLSYVPQQPILLSGSISENIKFEESRGDEKELDEIIALVGLSPWLDQLPKGLNTSLGENSIRISGGQRQRLAIARALYMHRDVILLDEITNNLDESAANNLVKMIVQLPKTVVMVTHDESLLTYFDRAYKLENGKLMVVDSVK